MHCNRAVRLKKNLFFIVNCLSLIIARICFQFACTSLLTQWIVQTEDTILKKNILIFLGELNDDCFVHEDCSNAVNNSECSGGMCRCEETFDNHPTQSTSCVRSKSEQIVAYHMVYHTCHFTE